MQCSYSFERCSAYQQDDWHCRLFLKCPHGPSLESSQQVLTNPTEGPASAYSIWHLPNVRCCCPYMYFTSQSTLCGRLALEGSHAWC
jgi:hypothetical protein